MSVDGGRVRAVARRIALANWPNVRAALRALSRLRRAMRRADEAPWVDYGGEG